MALSMHSGGGMSGGGGMGGVAMAYQTPGPSSGPSGSGSTPGVGSAVPLMRSDNSTTATLSVLDGDEAGAFRLRSCVVAFDLAAGTVAYLEGRENPPAADETLSPKYVMAVVSSATTLSPILLRRDDEKGFKALKKFLKRGEGVEKVFERLVVSDPKEYEAASLQLAAGAKGGSPHPAFLALPVDVLGLVANGFDESFAFPSNDPCVRFDKKSDSLLLGLMSDPEDKLPFGSPVSLRLRDVLCIYIYASLCALLPQSCLSPSSPPIVTFPLSGNLGDSFRTVLRGAVDSLPFFKPDALPYFLTPSSGVSVAVGQIVGDGFTIGSTPFTKSLVAEVQRLMAGRGGGPDRGPPCTDDEKTMPLLMTCHYPYFGKRTKPTTTLIGGGPCKGDNDDNFVEVNILRLEQLYGQPNNFVDPSCLFFKITVLARSLSSPIPATASKADIASSIKALSIKAVDELKSQVASRGVFAVLMYGGGDDVSESTSSTTTSNYGGGPDAGAYDPDTLRSISPGVVLALKGAPAPKTTEVFVSSPHASAQGALYAAAVAGGDHKGRMAMSDARKPFAVQDVMSSTVALRITLRDAKADKGSKDGDKSQQKTRSYIKTAFELGRSLPAKFTLRFDAAELTAAAFEGGAVGEHEHATLDKYAGKKGAEMRDEVARSVKVDVVERRGAAGPWKPIISFNEDGVREDGDERTIEPLYCRLRGAKEYTSVENTTMMLTIDAAGLLRTKLTSDFNVVKTSHKRDSTWWWRMWIAIAVVFFAAISYRTYVVTIVFQRNVRKLIKYYEAIGKKINSEQEARYVVYQYQDKEDKLWAKLEKKYNVKVLEPHEWPVKVDGVPQEPPKVSEDFGKGDGDDDNDGIDVEL